MQGEGWIIDSKQKGKGEIAKRKQTESGGGKLNKRVTFADKGGEFRDCQRTERRTPQNLYPLEKETKETKKRIAGEPTRPSNRRKRVQGNSVRGEKKTHDNRRKCQNYIRKFKRFNLSWDEKNYDHVRVRARKRPVSSEQGRGGGRI